MSATAIQMKINLDKSKYGQYYRVPYKFNRKGYAASKIEILSMIYSFSTSQNGQEPVCRLSYNQIERELGYKAPTISKALSTLKEEGLIQAVVRDKDGTGYRYVSEEKLGRKYDVAPTYLFRTKFMIEGEWRKLKPSTIRLLDRMITDVNKSGGAEAGTSSASLTQYAYDLGLSRDTVKKAIRFLLRAKFIFRPKEDKGTHKDNVSTYHVNKDLFFYKDHIKRPRSSRKERVSPEIEAANAKAERDRFYAQRREKAIGAAEKAKARANKSPEFREISLKLAKMNRELAEAELYNPDKLPALYKEKERLQDRRRELLRLLDMEEADLEPRFMCQKCEDTGFHLHDGRACDCYKRE